MLTTYNVRLPDGTVTTCTTLEEVRALAEANPDAQVQVYPVVRYRPCPVHQAYEKANCPRCGTHVND